MGHSYSIDILFFLLILIVRPVTVLLHELGHAIPAMLFTSEEVSIYIGSNGDPNKSLRLNIGKLNIWFRYNPLSWKIGFCTWSAKRMTLNRQIMCILTGPLASGIVAVGTLGLAFYHNLHGLGGMVFSVIGISGCIDMIINLVPRKVPVKLYDGRLIYNDGRALKNAFLYRGFPEGYMQAIELYNQQKFSEAAACLIDILKSNFRHEDIYRLAMMSFMMSKDYKQAEKVADDFMAYGDMNANDLSNAGACCSNLEQHDKALQYYSKGLDSDPENIHLLNNTGYSLTALNRFEEAIHFLDKAIETDRTYAYAYNNRGLAKIKVGQTEEGLADIDYSLKLDPNNAGAYRNLGVYHLENKEYSRAYDLFRRAKELDSSTPMIDELLTEALKYE